MLKLPKNHAALTPPKAEDATASQAPRRQLRQGPMLAQHHGPRMLDTLACGAPPTTGGSKAGVIPKLLLTFKCSVERRLFRPHDMSGVGSMDA